MPKKARTTRIMDLTTKDMYALLFFPYLFSCHLQVESEIRFMALIACRECAEQVSDSAKACPRCGKEISRNSFLVPLGYLCAFGALLLPPIIFGPAGMLIGLINCAKGRVGTGLFQIVIALICTIVGMVIGVIVSDPNFWKKILG